MVKTRRSRSSRRNALSVLANIEEDNELQALLLSIIRILDAMPGAG